MEARTLDDGPGTRVTVEVDWNVVEATIEADLFEDGPAGEDLDSWRCGAVYGARHALDGANSLPCAVRITEIMGEVETTTATMVAAACAHAVWEAIGYAPSEEQTQALDLAVAASLGASPDELPGF